MPFYEHIMDRLVLMGCDQPLLRNDLEAIQARGYLVMATRNNSACYYQGPNGPAGFEYDLVKAFADRSVLEYGHWCLKMKPIWWKLCARAMPILLPLDLPLAVRQPK